MSDTLDRWLPSRQLNDLDAALAAPAAMGDGPGLARRIGELGSRLLADGLDGLHVAGILSSFNDRLVSGIVEQIARRHRLPQVEWCWLALGSEGRREQTLVTDQDNALIFSAVSAQEADVLRDLFLPFADEVNRELARCGFALCRGGIMAGNPAWCLSIDEWRERIIDWVRRPEPQALLNASIFFDFRPLFGQHALAEALRDLLLALTSETPAFQRLMAANALAAEVPLGFRGELQLDEAGEVDLKKYGSRIFVDAARIFALAGACPQVATNERMRAAGAASGLPDAEVATLNAAFSQLLRLRLLGQQVPGALGHGLKPAALNEVDQAILRESLKQARRLQQRLKLNYVL